METTALQKIVAANRPQFDLWAQQLAEHLTAQFEPDSQDKQEQERIFFQTNELLFSIASNFFTYGKFKDQWDTSKCSTNIFGQYLLLKSGKMDLSFQWGLDNDGFFIESYIIHPENLRHMTDEFWSPLLALKSLGKFEYRGNGRLSAQERPFFENKTSTVFQMIRHFMLFQIDQMESADYHPKAYLDLGQLVLKWEVDAGWDTLLAEACQAFKILYQLNYQLWKISYLSDKKLRA